MTAPSFDAFLEIFARPHFEAYHPLHLLSYWLDVPWLGVDGPAIHATSLALWILALWALLEAFWALRLGLALGIAATLLVGLHPVQVEAVVWATGRKDILALGFSALAIVSHARSRAPFDRWTVGALVAYAAAGLSKTTALPLPLILLAADRLLLDRSWKDAALRAAPCLLVGSGMGLTTLLIWDDAQMIREGVQPLSLAAASLSHHLSTAFWPSSCSPLYAIDRGNGFSILTLLAGPTVLGVAALAAWRAADRQVLFGLTAFALWLAPVSNLVPLYFQWQDRYLSLPLVGLAFALASGLRRLPPPRSWAVAALLVGALGIRTAQYTGVWSDGVTLFGHAATTHPSSFYAWVTLGHARRSRGHLQGAVTAYSRAIDAANLALAHDARFRALMLLDERERELAPSRADEALPRFHRSLRDAEQLRALAAELLPAGYRRTVALLLDQSFALSPVSDEQLERAALSQLQQGNEWLADFYLSRLRRPPVIPELRERTGVTD